MRRVINHISQWAALTLLVHERWAKSQAPFIITIDKGPKTHAQLAYLHAEVLPKLTQALMDSGEIRSLSEGASKYWLKREIGYGNYYAFNGGVVFDGDSFQRATLDTLIQAIDTAIDEAAKRGITINPPKDKYGR